MDYTLPKRDVQLEGRWEVYCKNGGARSRPLRALRHPLSGRKWIDHREAKRPSVTLGMAGLSNYSAASNFHAWTLSKEDMDCWSFEVSGYFRSILTRATNSGRKRLPKATVLQQNFADAVQTCQIRCSSPRRAIRQSRLLTANQTTKATKYRNVPTAVKHIFDNEPEKYIQSWLPVHNLWAIA